jgi:D-glycero-D-manno-heptose 1,7-bisphosphate phosphatase
MIRQASEQFAIDLARSFVVGDKIADVDLAAGIGARGILVRTGYGEAEVKRHSGDVPGAAYVAAELMDATTWILLQSGRRYTESHLT